MADLSFRVAQLEDSPEIVRLINAAMRPEPGKGGWTSEANLVSGERTNLDEIRQIIGQESNVFILGLSNDKIVACVHIDGSNKEEAYLGTMSVEPALQNSGIAKALGLYTNEYASTVMGVHFLITQILAPRHELIASAFKYGYEQTGRAFPYKDGMGVGTPKRDNLVMIELHRLSRNWVKRKLNILFSRRPELEEKLRIAFQPTEHNITFDDFTAGNIAHYDLVVPLTLADLKYASENRHLLRDNGLPLPGIEVIRLLEDKLLLNRELVNKGFGKYIPRMEGAMPFPYLLKKRFDEHNSDIHLISNQQDELQFSQELSNPDYFRQLLVPAKEHYSTHILFKNKKIVRSRTVKYNHGRETANEIILAEEASCPELVRFRTLLNSIGFEGLCSINYLLLKGHVYILGINPVFDDNLAALFPQFVDVIA